MGQLTEQEMELEKRKLALEEKRLENENALELRKIQVAETNQADEITLKREEFELKREEIRIQSQDLIVRRRLWLIPIVVGILMATLGFVVNAWIEGYKADKSLRANLILQAIKTGNPVQASRNLRFLIDIGLLEDEGGAIQQANFSTVAYLPGPQSSRPEFETEVIQALQQHIADFEPRKMSSLTLGELGQEARSDLRSLALQHFRKFLNEEFFTTHQDWTVADLVGYVSLNIEPSHGP